MTGLQGFALGSGSDISETLAGFGIGCAAAMWWTIDGMHADRRAEFPYVSTWSGIRFWMLVVPAHVFTTRPRRRALKLIALHALATGAVTLVGVGLGR